MNEWEEGATAVGAGSGQVPLFDDNAKPKAYEEVMEEKLAVRARNPNVRHLGFLVEAYEVGGPSPG
jgi:hypothetical protein